MSKMDNLRAMREARYAAASAGAATPTSAPPKAAKPTAAKPSPRTRPAVAAERTSGSPTSDPSDDPGTATGLCGHRNMGGRTCTREAGHAAKSHRYS